ncbi:MAG: hypothetical protein HRT73_10820 [Flavobacteriales bacterium]|nr:hypothetical protein [Flavobacteriales bacterium]
MNSLKYTILILTLMLTSVLIAQNYEGTIEFTKKNHFDETKYIYYITSSKIRIDELKKDGAISGTMLVDLKTKKVTAINHGRKMHMNIKSKPSIKDLSKCETFKTTEKKKIL